LKSGGQADDPSADYDKAIHIIPKKGRPAGSGAARRVAEIHYIWASS